MVICVLLALAFNFNVLQNEFGWDDEKIINGLGASSSVSKLFFPASGSGVKSGAPYYRPLVSLSYRIDHAIWGKNPFGYHFSVLLFHLLNTALVFILARSLLSFSPHSPVTSYQSLIPVLSASLFAVHPGHSEAVAWIAGRNDVFCTTFVLASFVGYLQFSRNRSKLAFTASMLGFAAALLTKEMAVGMLVLFPFLQFILKQNPKGDSNTPIRKAGPLHLIVPLLIAAVYFSLRSQGLASPFGGSAAPTPFETISPAYLIPVFGHYVLGLVFPFPHRPYLTGIPSPLALTFFSVLVMVFFVRIFIRAARKTNVPALIGLAWFVFLLTPALALPLLGLGATTSLADRYLYAPSAGFLFFFSWILLKGPGFLRRNKKRRGDFHPAVLISISLVLILGFGLQSYKRNSVWRDPLSFWSTAVKNLKAEPVPAAIALDNLGTAYQNAGQWNEAEASYLEAVRLNPDFSQAHANLGVLYKYQGRADPSLFEKALHETGEALRLAPRSVEARNNLGDIYALQGRLDEALREYQEVLKMTPRNARVHNNVGIMFRQQGRYPDAIREHQLALEYDPGMAEARINLGSVYLEIGENTKALVEYKKGLVMDPSNVIATFGKAVAYERTGDIHRAREAFQKTLGLDPNHALAREALTRLGG